jgi:hypothetical protein
MKQVEDKVVQLLELARSYTIREKLNMLEAMELGICTVDDLINRVTTQMGINICCDAKHVTSLFQKTG